MATSTGPDLTYATSAVNALMDDTVTVTRYSPGANSPAAVEDPDSFQITEPVRQVVYDGQCILSNSGGDYTLKIPLDPDGTQIRPGDLVEPSSSRRDPDMVGRAFTVEAETPVKTFSVLRRFALVEISRTLPSEGE